VHFVEDFISVDLFITRSLFDSLSVGSHALSDGVVNLKILNHGSLDLDTHLLFHGMNGVGGTPSFAVVIGLAG